MTVRLPLVLDRGTPFSYECRSCRSCCVDNVVHVSPYDIARIADHRRLTTTEVIERFTTHSGTTLVARPDGACVFLEEHGCSIHPDRPMICRLYPLGRSADEDGREVYVLLEPHPESRGIYADAATVDRYLEQQGVGPFLRAAERYLEILLRMRALIDRPASSGAENGGPGSLRAEGSRSLDMDPAVARYCQAHGLEVPRSVEDKLALHIRALHEWLDGLEQLSSLADS